MDQKSHAVIQTSRIGKIVWWCSCFAGCQPDCSPQLNFWFSGSQWCRENHPDEDIAGVDKADHRQRDDLRA